MRVRFPLVVGLVSLAALKLSSAQDAPPPNADSILRDLDQMEQKQKQAVIATRQTAAAQIQAAASNPAQAAELYAQAVEATQFDGMKGKGASFAEWKSSHSALLRTHEMQTILAFHLRYLALSLQRAASDKPQLFAQPAYDYAKDLANYDPTFLKLTQKGPDQPNQHEKDEMATNKEILAAKKELLGGSLNDSIFVKWFRIEALLPKGDDWELKPGDIAGIIRKDVRPVLRKAKDPRLIETWEFEMQVAANRVTFGRLEHDATDFNTVTRPQMQFDRANDMVEIGQKNRAVAEIYSMVKAYPQHADFGKWIQRLRELLKSPTAPAASSSEAAAAAGPEATPPATSSAAPGTTQP